MNRVTINLHALQHNLNAICKRVEARGASWSVVTKAVCGHLDVVRALHRLGVQSIADSRLENLREVQRILPALETWYLRLPDLSGVQEVVELADLSLNSEVAVIKALSQAARARDRIHRIVIMIELGDLREGILPGSLVKFYDTVFDLPNIEVIGLGAQVGCLAGAIPNVDQMSQLLIYRELLELKFNRKLPVVSAGSSILLSQLDEGLVPRGINHFRIGEALFLGTDLVTGGILEGLRDDVVTLEAEVAEVKEKNLVASGETGAATPFDALESPDNGARVPGERGYRALVTVGQIDTDVQGLTPLDSAHSIAGASSDITVVNIGDDLRSLTVGSHIRFRPSYSAFVRLMNDPYIRKEVVPPLSEFRVLPSKTREVAVPAALPGGVT